MPQKYWDNYCKYMDKHLESSSWSDRIRFYCSLFFSLLVIFVAVFLVVFIIYKITALFLGMPNNTIFSQYNTTQLRNMGFFDNERYLISALVQSLAATIALVVSLSLIAIQFAAESHSSRIIEFYKRNPDMWILISIYIVVIFYGLALLKVIDIGVAGITMEIAIYVAYFLGFFAFICLIPYIWSTLNLLKISTAIKWFEEDITKENVLAALEDGEDITEKDPVQPIIDIINSALERNDYETVRNGLKTIRKRTILIFEKSHFEYGEEDKFSRYIVGSIKNIAILAIQKENTNSTLSAIMNLETIGTKAVEYNLEKTAGWTAEALENIGIKAVNADFKSVISDILTVIGKIGLKSAEKELTGAVGIAAKELDKIGVALLQLLEPEITQERLEEQIIKELTCVGIKTAEMELNNETRYIVNLLGKMSKKVLDERWKIEANVEAFEKEIIDRFKMRLESLINETTEAFSNIGAKAAEMRNHKNTGKHQEAKEKVQGIVGEKTEVEWEIVGALQNIGTKAVEIKHENISIKTVEELGNAGTRAAEQNLEKTTMKAVEALEILGMKSMEYEKDLIAKSAVEELYELWSFLSQKEIMKPTVLKIEDAFNSFASNSLLKYCKETWSLATRIVEQIDDKSKSAKTNTSS